MDVSYDENNVDHIIADLNRMKQGTQLDCKESGSIANLESFGQSDYKRRQVYIKEERREENNCLHGSFQRPADFIST